MKSENRFGSMILPDGNYYSLDDRATRMNNNVMVVGTTGAAKTRTVITPNLLECVGSYVVTDPKGNLYRKWGSYMQENGYRVLRLSFTHPEDSVKYNPMKYVKTTQQIQQLSNMLTYSDRSCNRGLDPLWDECTIMLLNGIIYYVKEMYKDEKQNLHEVLNLLREAERDEMVRNSHKNRSALEDAMDELNMLKPNNWGSKQFYNVNLGTDKTFASVAVTATSKFATIDTEEVAMMMETDEIDIPTIGQRKTAVFVEVSDTDRSMDTLINLFFTQTMNQLCTYADEECRDNQLPVPVRFFMDDFATNCRISNFENMISNIRSRKISVIMALQSLSQLEAGYGDSAHTIADDCDTLIYMGGNDPETAQQIAIRCDKTTTSILHMPLCSSWIFRRGEKPFMCRNMELDDYLRERDMLEEEALCLNQC